jgi:hypothetical protein
MVIPRDLRDEAGVSEGTLMKVAVVEGGKFLVTPQLTVDRSVVNGGSKDRKSALRDLAQIVAELRKEAKEKGLDTMPRKEINRAVTTARRDLKKIHKRPAK